MMLNTKRVGFGFGCLVVSISVILSFHLFKPAETSDSKISPNYKFPKRQMDLRGFNYKGIRNEKTILAIQADRFSINRKKLGPFRLGLVKEATFDNAVFKVYEHQKKPGNQRKYSENKKGKPEPGANINSHKPFANNDPINSENNKADYVNAFSNEIFQNFPIKGITGFNASPVKIEFYRIDGLKTELTANKGFFNFREDSLIIKGNAKAMSGDRVLVAEQFIFNPKKALITAEEIRSNNLQAADPAVKHLVMDTGLNVVLNTD